MTIREAERKDSSRLDELLTELIHYEARLDGNLNPAYTVKDNYAERLALEGHRAFVAEEDGRIVGFLYGFLYHIPGVWLHPIVILDALYVEEAHRGKGIAGKLFCAFREFAAAHGAGSIELKVLSRNSGAIGLYEQLGFREAKKYMELPLSGDEDQ